MSTAPFGGSRFGPYEIVDHLGEGGMGAVWLAVRADDAYRKRVAIKTLPPGPATRAAVERFLRERSILGSLDHPNVAALLDGGTTPEGLPWFAMEYVEGEPIDRHCESRSLSVPDRLRLFLSACDAVQHAHAHLVVHRDLKPANVLVTPDGVPKLLDFGIARLIELDAGQTATAVTPDCASPEQVRGGRITTATDVYALGVLLHRLLTGRGPYRLRTAGIDELLEAICLQDAEPPSAVARRGGDRAAARRLEGDLDTIVLRALRKDPADRYPSVELLAGDLRRHLAGLPVNARPPTLAYTASKFVRRHRAGVVAAIAVSAAMAGTIVAAARQVRVSRAERARADRRFDQVRKLANTLLFEFHGAIEKLPGSTAARELVIRRGQEYLDRLASDGAADAPLRAELAHAYEMLADIRGGANASLGDGRTAVDFLRKAVALRQAAVAADPKNPEAARALARALRQQGGARMSAGDAAGLADIQRALRMLEDLGRRAPSDAKVEKSIAITDHTLATALEERGEYGAAAGYMRDELRIFEALAAASPKDADAQRNVALACKYLGALLAVLHVEGEPAALLRRAVAIDRARVGSDAQNAEAVLDLSFSEGALGDELDRTGDEHGALEQYRAAAVLREQVARADKANATARMALARIHRRIGTVLGKLGDPEAAAIEMLKSAAEQEPIAADPSARPDWRSHLGQTYADLGDDEVALADRAAAAGHERSAHCRAARGWFLKSDRIRQELESEGVAIPEQDAISAERNSAGMARCDASVARAR